MKKTSERNLNKFFNPNSVAILGASRDEKKLGHIVLKNIVNSGFRGKIFPVNPNSENIIGIDCYKNYKDLPESPDLAILALPAALAISLLEDIAKKNTKNIIIFSAGFKEAGPEGEKMENDLRFLAEKLGLNVLGPNCLGFASTLSSLNATFSKVGGEKGNLRFMSQSGALASAIFDWAQENNFGFSEFITLGNKAVLNENDILKYWLSQPKPKLNQTGLSNYQPIGLYLESINAGREFLELASKASLKDPIFILKPGKSKHAQQAIHSHTGSMAGDDAVQDAAFAQAGIIRCQGIEDMFDLAKVFSWENAPRGPKVAIISNAGGPAVISTDALEVEGLELAALSQKTLTKLKNNLPAASNIFNPVDVLGDALSDRYYEAINDVLAEKNVDALVVILTPQVMTEAEVTAEKIAALSAKYGKPVVCSFMGGEMIEDGEKILNKYKIPSFRFPERAVKALAKMWQWQSGIKKRSLKLKNLKPLAKNITIKIDKLVKSAEKNNKVLPAAQADQILSLSGIKVPPATNIKNLIEAQQFSEKNNWPVVLKISSPAMLHKTEAGGVIKNIKSNEDLEKAWNKISSVFKKLPNKKDSSIQIQKQVDSGVEVIVGIKHDASFGNVLMFGAGGILAELVWDSNLKMLPADENGIRDLIFKSKVSKVLKGFRNQKVYAVNKLVDLIVKLSNLAQSVPYFSEITINPIIVTEKDAWAVDPRIILK
ncbi:MAG TPA: acetate--CoA ligase family protein [Candidatus Udaeobacter sp.]|nr:acetate--CoA ligase family protein [Candidatus Udaeobacter sp.]